MSDTAAGEGAGTGHGTGEDPFTRFIRDIDFPQFVDDLLRGVFDSIVDASIRQMKAYGELVKHVAGAVDRFAEEVARAGSDFADDLCSCRAETSTGAASEQTGESGSATESGAEPAL